MQTEENKLKYIKIIKITTPKKELFQVTFDFKKLNSD